MPSYDNTLSAAEVDAEVDRLLSGGRPPRLTDAEDSAQIAAAQAARERAEQLEASRGLLRPSTAQPDKLTPRENAEVARLLEQGAKDKYRAS